MFGSSDTIVALATPPGRGALGVIRLSGPDAHAIARRLLARTRPLEPRSATPARVHALGEPAASAFDEVVATYFPAPRSYTAEDVVEIGTHGSPVVVEAVLAAALRAGARLARPGEFTFRAFVNGRLDLPRAEAVADLIEAQTPRQARAAFEQLEGALSTHVRDMSDRLFDLVARVEASLDFPDEGYHFIDPDGLSREIAAIRISMADVLRDARTGRVLREGATVVIAGRPNTGKSSVFNRLLDRPRAIVSELPGTTRDLVSEAFDLNGVPVHLVDTAGVRSAFDALEAEGVRRAEAAREAATLVLVVLDRSEPLTAGDRDVLQRVGSRPHLRVMNKCDRPAAWSCEAAGGGIPTAATTGEGFDALRAAMLSALCQDEVGSEDRSIPRVTNVRHMDLLRRADEALGRAASVGAKRAPEEVVLLELNDARDALEEIAGRRTREDVLEHIFARFCIGK